MRILYYGCGWPTNIGNAFIDLGATAILRQVFPEAHIGWASEMPRWLFRHGAPTRHRSQPADDARMEHALDIAAITACDLVVFSGMAMCDEFIQVNGPAIRALAGRGTDVLLLGTGGDQYTEQENEHFREFLTEVQPLAFISRDDRSYWAYADCVEHSYRGIDCGFFLGDGYQPLPLTLPPYVAVAFDSVPEPEVELNGRTLVRAHHMCWGPANSSLLQHEMTLISDVPQDYLTLYAGAEEVHSDRVHACVAALAYGRAARLYHPTPRGGLFEAAGAGGIRDRLVRLHPEELEAKKAAQIEIVRKLLTKAVPV